MDRSRRAAVVGRRTVPLSPTEYELLRMFLDHPGETLTKADLFRQVWGYDFRGNPNVIQTYVSYLRRKLGPQFRRQLSTVRGEGYRYDPNG